MTSAWYLTRASTQPGPTQRRQPAGFTYQVSNITGINISNLSLLEFPHRFKKGLKPITTVLEDSKVVFDVEVEDEQADVRWFHNDKELKPEQNR